MNETTSQMEKLIRQSKSIAITSHESPDGDCVGSVLGLGLALQAAGKDVHIILSDPVPERLHYIPSWEIIEKPDANRSYDLFILVDLGDLPRMGKSITAMENSKTSICFDHHRTNQYVCDINYVDIDASSTCEILAEFLFAYHFDIPKDAATALYTGIITDSNRFLYDRARAKTMRLAADLLDKGALADRIYFYEYSNHDPDLLALTGSVMKNMEYLHNGRLVLAKIPNSLQKEFRVDYEDVEGVVGDLRDIKGVEVAVMLKEKSANDQKISLRAKEYFDVSEIAVHFGGGGHRKAAGASIHADFETAYAQLKHYLEEMPWKECGEY